MFAHTKAQGFSIDYRLHSYWCCLRWRLWSLNKRIVYTQYMCMAEMKRCVCSIEIYKTYTSLHLNAYYCRCPFFIPQINEVFSAKEYVMSKNPTMTRENRKKNLDPDKETGRTEQHDKWKIRKKLIWICRIFANWCIHYEQFTKETIGREWK